MDNKEKVFWHKCFELFYGEDAPLIEMYCGWSECSLIKTEIVESLVALLNTYGEYCVSDVAKFLVIGFERIIGGIEFLNIDFEILNDLAIEFDELYDEILNEGVAND